MLDIAPTVVVIIGGLTFCVKLDELMNERPDNKNEMVTTIINFENASIPDVLKKSNQIFNRLFDIIFMSKSDKISRFIWNWIFLSFGLNLFFGIFFAMPLNNILAVNVLISFIYLVSINYIENNFESIEIQAILHTLTLIILISIISKFCIIINLQNAYINLQNVLPLQNIILLIIFVIATELFHFPFNVNIPISPSRVVISSILAMIFIALFHIDIAQSFISEFNKNGSILFAYLLLNIMADSISLLETKAVLFFASEGNMKKLGLCLIFDCIFTILIFLAIPYSTGNLGVFLDSIRFQGELPWLGIFFYSTFFTSVIFWLYLSAILVQMLSQKFLSHYVKFDNYLPISEKPITCLYLFAVVFFTPLVFILT